MLQNRSRRKRLISLARSPSRLAPLFLLLSPPPPSLPPPSLRHSAAGFFQLTLLLSFLFQ